MISWIQSKCQVECSLSLNKDFQQFLQTETLTNFNGIDCYAILWTHQWKYSYITEDYKAVTFGELKCFNKQNLEKNETRISAQD